MLLIAFCLNALSPDGPFYYLQIQGQQGSGKSIIGVLVKLNIDPNFADKLRLPRADKDLVLQAQQHWLLNYENASHISNDLSDLLCTVSTGGAFSTRKLYEDDEMKSYAFKRPFMINGISNFANRSDLQQRAIVLDLEPIEEGNRKTERELNKELDRLRPGFLGYLFDCVAHALANLDQIEPPRDLRMADAAHWIAAAEGATGFENGSLLKTLEEAQTNLMAQTAIEDELTVALLLFLNSRPKQRFEGLASTLHNELGQRMEKRSRYFPSTPTALSGKLKRMQPSLKMIGVEFTEGQRTNAGQPWEISLSSNAIKLAQQLEESGGHNAEF